MTCTITGYLRDPTGAPAADTAVVITAQAITASADGAMLPRRVEVATDAAGRLAVDLLPGRYALHWRSPTQHHIVPLSVPAEASADLADLLVASPAPVRGSAGRGWTGGHYDHATGRIVFESADGLAFETPDLRGAGAALPPGAPGQLVGYGPTGAPEAVDPPLPQLASQQW